uniref:EPS8 signaling adaptor L3b n=1 Tax=Erpetoichthys calabaricus TaxID=27687 RepID=A0A8C4RRZ6_ERPCA
KLITYSYSKNVVIQRKEYAEEVNKQVRNVEYRVEHLFSCELDQKDLKTVDDCISRLKLLDARGRVWGQEMILQVKNGSLQLMDIEAKEELESFSLSSILDCQAVINSCVYSSILSVTVQEKSKRRRSVLLFQCDEFGEIINHVLDDIEVFINKVNATVVAHSLGKNKKKKKKKEKSGKLNANCPRPDLAQSTLSPLLTMSAIDLMNNTVTSEEFSFWRMLGDAWNIPRSQWAESDSIPPYFPVFYDGWELPPLPSADQETEEYMDHGRVERDSYRAPSENHHDSKQVSRKKKFIIGNHSLRPTIKLICIFSPLQVLNNTKQWWKVRDMKGEEGFVPNNILESTQEQQDMEQKSRPEEVKVWLQYKGFTKITVKCLGVLSGAMLLGMTREEIKTVCPEEGGKVFFQLQAVKSSLAVR